MSKQRINDYLPLAYDALSECGIAINGAVDNALRAQIASFGAAVAMGSLLSAIAFFSQQGAAMSERQLLMKAIHWVLLKSEGQDSSAACVKSLGLWVRGLEAAELDAGRERILDAAVAIKLAMNLYDQDRVQTAEGVEVKP